MYLVTSPKRPAERLVSIVAAALDGGVSVVQLRDKGAYSDAERKEVGHALREQCTSHDVPFLVNDDPELARQLDADGVHVGREDPSPVIARAVLGPGAIIGVTVYGRPEEEDAAARAGADYISVGAFFPSRTKPEEPLLPLDLLDGVVRRSRVPVFAIGGITVDNAGLFARHGVAGVAVVSAIMDAADPRGAADSLRRAFLRTATP
ncbi:MAG TPA: thiamine phosphate synthase [Thermoplasmata archaeon]|nr:thiamine phosphate synthase [Thermoplasmata archaeon]